MRDSPRGGDPPGTEKPKSRKCSSPPRLVNPFQEVLFSQLPRENPCLTTRPFGIDPVTLFVSSEVPATHRPLKNSLSTQRLSDDVDAATRNLLDRRIVELLADLETGDIETWNLPRGCRL